MTRRQSAEDPCYTPQVDIVTRLRTVDEWSDAIGTMDAAATEIVRWRGIAHDLASSMAGHACRFDDMGRCAQCLSLVAYEGARSFGSAGAAEMGSQEARRG